MIIMPHSLFLKNRRSKTETWKKEDIDKYFNVTELKEDPVKKGAKLYDKYFFYVLSPASRFNQSTVIEEKLNDFADVLYFKVFGIDRETDPLFVRYIDCGYATLKKDSFRIIKF